MNYVSLRLSRTGIESCSFHQQFRRSDGGSRRPQKMDASDVCAGVTENLLKRKKAMQVSSPARSHNLNRFWNSGGS